MNAWGDSLTEADYNYQIWGNPANVFHRMSNQLSSVFKLHSASVNFILVGACDGTHDKTISERFIPNSHWRAAFVEAISINVRDLNFFLANRSVADRSFVLHAAATNICYNATIPVQRPRLEEKSLETKKEIAHWMRRQIGGIATKNHLLPKGAQEDRANWLTEDVRCVTGGDVIREWATVLYNEKLAARNILRPHVLKIDAEGHDYEVLMSFVSPDISDAQLPLLIDFEAKSLNENYPKTVELLKSRYDVCPYGSPTKD